MKDLIMRRIREGFSGQKILILPPKVVDQIAGLELTKNLYLTDIGVFPNARFHYVKRFFNLPQFILIYCTEGNGWYKMEKQHHIQANQYFILPANRHHSYGADSQKPWTIYWFHFSGILANGFWEIYRSRHYPVGMIPFSQHRITLFGQLYDTLDKGYSQEHLRFSSQVLWYLLSSFLYPYLFEQRDENPHSDRIDKAIALMQQNLSVKLSLTQLAKHVNYSIPHFIAELKKKTGYSPIDYHNRLRIQKACQYLDLTDMRIKEVSYLLGYKDPYYFSRLFSKIVGQSPRSYKNRVKG